MRNYILTAALSATANNVASIEIAQAGTLRQVNYSLNGDMDADGDFIAVELSQVPYITITTNDGVGAFMVASAFSSNTVNLLAINESVAVHVPVRNGDRIYINCAMTGITSANFYSVLTVA